MSMTESVPVVSVLLGGEAAGQHPADGLLSAVDVVLQVPSLRQLPHELTLLVQQGELESRETGEWRRHEGTSWDVLETTLERFLTCIRLVKF